MSFAPLHDPSHRTLFGDNHSGAHPEVLEALSIANVGHVPAYGADPYTDALKTLIRETFGDRAEVYPVWTGSGANVVALTSMTDRWDGVVCARTAHINLDELGAPEKLTGLKMLPVDGADGKITTAAIDEYAGTKGVERRAQPSTLSITQCTELGTLYTTAELAELTAYAHRSGTRVHMDGARLPNAAAALGVGLREAVGDVDVLSLGGTKNGLLGAEAVVVLNPDAVRGTSWIRKFTCQLPSKMRFVSAQLLALYGTDLWQRNAEHANAMAARLGEALTAVPGVRLSRPVQTNAAFARVPESVLAGLPVWNTADREIRLMASFDTTDGDIAQAVDRLTL